MASQIRPGQMPPKRRKQKRQEKKFLFRRVALRKMSDSKRRWTNLYHDAVQERKAKMRAANNGRLVCERCGDVTDRLEPHHPLGQHGVKILTFVFLGNNFSDCRCHAWVEDHKKLARAEGWIKYK